MGCASSKQDRCRHCGQTPNSPVRRSYSLHVHHPPQHKDDSYHVVALTSSTLGSLKLEISNQEKSLIESNISSQEDGVHKIRYVDVNTNGNCNADVRDDGEKKGDEFSLGLMEAKNWSNMINEKIPKVIPKTPIRTPPGEPETINTWELMEGLEDTSPYLSPKHFRSFSFPGIRESSNHGLENSSSIRESSNNGLENLPSTLEKMSELPRPMWLQNSDDDNDSKTSTVITDFDPDIISSFRKSLEELPPDNPFYLRPLESKEEEAKDSKYSSLDAVESKKVEEVVTDFDKPAIKEKVVFYFTSLRGIRKTYEDCCNVRMILKSIGVRLDERDVSMHSGFKDELRELLGNGFTGSSLPKVFIGKRLIGGAEEIRKLHEEGQLEKLLEGCKKMDDGGGTCEACGDIRFVPCETCSGSCKIYYDDEEEEEHASEEGDYGFQRCPDCNENGLVRCPMCCE